MTLRVISTTVQQKLNGRSRSETDTRRMIIVSSPISRVRMFLVLISFMCEAHICFPLGNMHVVAIVQLTPSLTHCAAFMLLMVKRFKRNGFSPVNDNVIIRIGLVTKVFVI